MVALLWGIALSGYWDNKLGLSSNLRLLTRDNKWLAWDDEEPNPNDPTSKRKPGCRILVEGALLAALHSTNVIVLLGSGASFSAKNPNGNQAPSMGDLWHAVRNNGAMDNTPNHSKFDKIALEVMGVLPPKDTSGNQTSGDIESLLSLCKMSLELLEVRFKADSSSVDQTWMTALRDFVKEAEKTILCKVDFVTAQTELTAHRALLQKFARRSVEKPRVKLFTTNYDLCLEEAALRLGVIVIDGFSHSAEQRFNRDHFLHDIVRRSPLVTKADYVDGVFHIYKLHGSVDWRRRNDGAVIRSRQQAAQNFEPVLIYPRSSKYQESFETPYLDMFAALQTSLREPDTTLIVAGFGFADDHISAPIWSALESNLSLRMILCDPSFVPAHKLDGVPPEHSIDLAIGKQGLYQKRIMKLVEHGDSRVTVLNGRFEDLADAMPMVIGDTDRQRLQTRLDFIREDVGV